MNGPKISKRLAQNLKAIRKSRNLTQLQLSQLSGVPKSTINHVEIGESSPSLDTVDAISKALSISIEELISKPTGQVEVLKANEMPEVKVSGSGMKMIRVLPDPFPGVDVYFAEFTSDAVVHGILQKTGGRKLIYCVSGAFKLVFGGKSYVIEKGGACVFSGDQPHSLMRASVSKTTLFKLHIY
jgi:transcriptional regulator with XRE-family HTH domain